MVEIEQVLQTPSFKKAVKKLQKNQKKDLDMAIKLLIGNPRLGEQKKGDLLYLRVYKFKMVKQSPAIFSVRSEVVADSNAPFATAAGSGLEGSPAEEKAVGFQEAQ